AERQPRSHAQRDRLGSGLHVPVRAGLPSRPVRLVGHGRHRLRCPFGLCAVAHRRMAQAVDRAGDRAMTRRELLDKAFLWAVVLPFAVPVPATAIGFVLNLKWGGLPSWAVIALFVISFAWFMGCTEYGHRLIERAYRTPDPEGTCDD